jgi:hypothetical protein
MNMQPCVGGDGVRSYTLWGRSIERGEPRIIAYVLTIPDRNAWSTAKRSARREPGAAIPRDQLQLNRSLEAGDSRCHSACSFEHIWIGQPSLRRSTTIDRASILALNAESSCRSLQWYPGKRRSWKCPRSCRVRLPTAYPLLGGSLPNRDLGPGRTFPTARSWRSGTRQAA